MEKKPKKSVFQHSKQMPMMRRDVRERRYAFYQP
jgi:hypothetical protein